MLPRPATPGTAQPRSARWGTDGDRAGRGCLKLRDAISENHSVAAEVPSKAGKPLANYPNLAFIGD